MADPQPSAVARCFRDGPPLDALVEVDGAPVGVSFRLALVDYATQEYWPFGPLSASFSQVGTRYRVPGPPWWQHQKTVRCNVAAQPGPGGSGRVRLVIAQGGVLLEDFAWDLLDEEPVDQAVLRVKLSFP